MIKPFKRAANLLKPVVIVGAAWNRLVSMVEYWSRLEVGGGLRLEKGPAGPVILGGGNGGKTLVPVQVSSVIASEYGRYNGKSITRETDTAATGALAADDIGTPAATEDTIIWSIAEIAASAHGIGVGKIVWGEVIGTTTDGKNIVQLPYYAQGAVPDPTAVRQVLQCTSFTAGTPPTFTLAFDYVRSHS